MRAFVGKATFAGNWDEDLTNTISVFETLATMCEVSYEEKLKSLPVMLSGDALNYYASNIKDCNDYEEAIELMKKWYNSDDKKS